MRNTGQQANVYIAIVLCWKLFMCNIYILLIKACWSQIRVDLRNFASLEPKRNLESRSKKGQCTCTLAVSKNKQEIIQLWRKQLQRLYDFRFWVKFRLDFPLKAKIRASKWIYSSLIFFFFFENVKWAKISTEFEH